MKSVLLKFKQKQRIIANAKTEKQQWQRRSSAALHVVHKERSGKWNTTQWRVLGRSQTSRKGQHGSEICVCMCAMQWNIKETKHKARASRERVRGGHWKRAPRTLRERIDKRIPMHDTSRVCVYVCTYAYKYLHTHTKRSSSSRQRRSSSSSLSLVAQKSRELLLATDSRALAAAAASRRQQQQQRRQ